jgi:uncharacterized protein
MFASLIDAALNAFGPAGTLALAGLSVGFLFGYMAQKSRFCLRSAVIEFVTGHFGAKLAIWLLTFGVAIVVIQFMIAHGSLSVSTIAALSARGSLSGAMIGGAMFGCGMVLSRGCASRLLVLSGTGNMRAVVAGLVFVIVTQSAYQGMLEPVRSWLAALWTVDGGPQRDLILRLGGREVDKFPVALAWLGAAFFFAIRGRIGFWGWIGGMGCGLAVALAYYLTYTISQAAMEPAAVKGVTFSGPSAEFLMRVLQHGEKPPGFDTTLVPGVFLGAAMAALLAREFKLTVFDAQSGTLRYIIGAALMGFGAMLAGGCAVGAGVSGGAIFALTAWLALVFMWIGAGLTHWLVDERSRFVSKEIKSGRLASGRLIR